MLGEVRRDEGQMSTLTKQAKQLSIPLAAVVALGCVLLYSLSLKMPPPSYDERPSQTLMSPPVPDPGPARSSAPAHVPPHVPELVVDKRQKRPHRFMPAGDPTTPAAQRLIQFLVAAQPTDAQQQLFFGLLWDARMEWDLLVDSNVTAAEHAAFPEILGEFYEQTDAEINRQMREALTPKQWEVYKDILNVPTSLFHNFPLAPEPEAERR
jgi:hypothetical protein